jgi:hypothetical protein
MRSPDRVRSRPMRGLGRRLVAVMLAGLVAAAATASSAGPAAAAGSAPVITGISVTGRTADATGADARFSVVIRVSDPDGDATQAGVLAAPSRDPDPVMGEGNSPTQLPAQLVSTDGGTTFTGDLVLPAGFATTWTLSAVTTDAQRNIGLVSTADMARLGAPGSVTTTVSAPPSRPTGLRVQGVWTWHPGLYQFFYEVQVSWNAPPAGTPVPAAFKILAAGSCISSERFVTVKTQSTTISRSPDAGVLNPICNVRVQLANSAGASAFTAGSAVTF